METIKDYKEFKSCDVSLERSLYEYGLIWKDNLFIYRVEGDSESLVGEQFFARGDMTEAGALELMAEDWFKWKSFMTYVGLEGTPAEYIKNNGLGNCVGSMLSYHGHLNIFGESYTGIFTIFAPEYETFASFLIDKEVEVEEYIRGFYKENSSSLEAAADDPEMVKHWVTLVDWEDMHEGYDFWEDLHNEWQARCYPNADFGITLEF